MIPFPETNNSITVESLRCCSSSFDRGRKRIVGSVYVRLPELRGAALLAKEHFLDHVLEQAYIVSGTDSLRIATFEGLILRIRLLDCQRQQPLMPLADRELASRTEKTSLPFRELCFCQQRSMTVTAEVVPLRSLTPHDRSDGTPRTAVECVHPGGSTFRHAFEFRLMKCCSKPLLKLFDSSRSSKAFASNPRLPEVRFRKVRKRVEFIA